MNGRSEKNVIAQRLAGVLEHVRPVSGKYLVPSELLQQTVDALAQPPAAGVGEEIMVNAAHDVYTLPLQPSGLLSGPRFVVHVPGPEQPAAVDEMAELVGLLDEVRSHFTRDDDLPDDLLPRIDAALAQVKGIPEVARQFRRSRDEAAYAEAERTKVDKLAQLAQGNDDGLDFAAKLVTYGHAPGYRDASLVFDLRPIGREQRPSFRAEIRLRPEDGEAIVHHILDVHRSAWDRSSPIDVKPGETRPRWIDRI